MNRLSNRDQVSTGLPPSSLVFPMKLLFTIFLEYISSLKSTWAKSNSQTGSPTDYHQNCMWFHTYTQMRTDLGIHCRCTPSCLLLLFFLHWLRSNKVYLEYYKLFFVHRTCVGLVRSVLFPPLPCCCPPRWEEHLQRQEQVSTLKLWSLHWDKDVESKIDI